MRCESEMLDLILNTARNDVRVRAVFMNGSRVNPNAKKDIFQDYDVVYVVNETKSFIKDRRWIDIFGDVMYMQYPEEGIGSNNNIEICYGWLIQFKDGNRLDLHVYTVDYAIEKIKEDSLSKVLLDKDKCLPDIKEPSDRSYWIKRPNNELYYYVCNQFWWCLNNICKGLWREEIPYVMDMLNYNIRPQLIEVLSWKIGFETNFKVSVGKSGKYMYRWLDYEEWNNLLCTYSGSNIEKIWDSVFLTCELFNKNERIISDYLGVNYNEEEAVNSFKFLKDVRVLPKDIKEIY